MGHVRTFTTAVVRRRRSVALALAGAGVLAAPSAASACSPLQPAGRLAAASQAVYGHVASVTPDPQIAGRYTATIRVARIYKGQRNTVVRVTGGVHGETPDGKGLTSCGGLTLVAGQRIALFLYGTKRPFELLGFERTTLTELTRLSGGTFKRPNRSL